MASVCDDGNGRRRVLFFDHNRKRRTLYLGKLAGWKAETIANRVEAIISSRITGEAPTGELSRWVAELPDALRAKLERLEVLPKRPSEKLGPFLRHYIAEREASTKASTRAKWGTVLGYLVDHFGEDRPLRNISAGDADSWRLALLRKGLAENTVRKASGIAKQWFKAAQRAKLIEENPFADLKAAIQTNTERFHFVDRETAERVLDACPDAEWRLLFALGRYGGLRMPSEIRELRWSDIHWDQGRFTVRASKTEHHDDGGVRVVPIFPELLPYLEDAFELAEPGETYCIRRYRACRNLGTQLRRIVQRAGLTPWPKLWQNLRSTRQTELGEAWPIQVVTAWIGNSPAVARKHYLQVTEDHFRRAATPAGEGSAESSAPTPRNGWKRTEPPSGGSARNFRSVPHFADELQTVAGQEDGPYWTATPPRIPEDSGHSEQGSAQSSALGSAAASDPLLAELLKQWPRLTLEDRERIAELLHHGGMR